MIWLAEQQACNLLFPMSNNPRFRTLHEAQKYISAQLYPAARGLNPEEFGAVPRYIENPVWPKAAYEVVLDQIGVSCNIIINHNLKIDVRPAHTMTSAEWYQLYPNPVILFADGWPDCLHQTWFLDEITLEEFEARRSMSVVDQ